MSHAIYHAQSSARRFGGLPEDYLAIHEWFDASKAFIADARHRALRHHAQGIFWCEEVFGRTVTNSVGRAIPVRLIGEQHVTEDFRRIPTLTEWLQGMPLEDWMFKTVAVLPKLFKEGQALPDLTRPQDRENVQQEADSLLARLAVINGQLHSEACRAVLSRSPESWSLETVLDRHQIRVRIFTREGEILPTTGQDDLAAQLPYPCLFYAGQHDQGAPHE